MRIDTINHPDLIKINNNDVHKKVKIKVDKTGTGAEENGVYLRSKHTPNSLYHP